MGRLTRLPARLATLAPRLARLSREEAEAVRSRDRDVNQAWRAWYKTARWQALKAKVHLRDNFMCRGCAKSHVVVGRFPAPNSPVADHIIPHRGDEALFWDEDNVQTVCKAYHDSEKQRLEAASRR